MQPKMWKKKYLISLLWLIAVTISYGQRLKTLDNIDLSDELEEISGLIIIENTGYGINDSGNEACLYSFSINNGSIIKKMCLKGVSNTDFEAITHTEDKIYIGDIGNNLANRSSFQIYEVDKSDVLNQQEKLNTNKIEFTLPNYSAFFSRTHNFDMEAMHCNFAGDSIYIYSKNRADSNVSVYGLAIDFTDRLQVAKKIGTFVIKELITAAYVYNADLYLLSYNRVNSVLYKVENFEANSIENWSPIEIQVPGIGFQRESLFIADDIFYIASEKTKIQKQSLYSFELK